MKNEKMNINVIIIGMATMLMIISVSGIIFNIYNSKNRLTTLEIIPQPSCDCDCLEELHYQQYLLWELVQDLDNCATVKHILVKDAIEANENFRKVNNQLMGCTYGKGNH